MCEGLLPNNNPASETQVSEFFTCEYCEAINARCKYYLEFHYICEQVHFYSLFLSAPPLFL